VKLQALEQVAALRATAVARHYPYYRNLGQKEDRNGRSYQVVSLKVVKRKRFRAPGDPSPTLHFVYAVLAAGRLAAIAWRPGSECSPS